MLNTVEPLSLTYFTRVLGYTVERAKVFMKGVKREMQDPQLHLYIAFHIVYGRRPKV